MRKKNLLYITVCFCFMTSLIVYPSVASDGVKYGLSLCASVLIPSLFPFTVASLVLFKLKVPVLSQKAIIMLLSHLGGYPVGAKLIDTAYKEKEIDKKTAELMLGYCVNSGPAFIIIVIGIGIWKSRTIGLILLTASILSSALIMLMNMCAVPKFETEIKTPKNHSSFSDIFVDATQEATGSMFKICGSVVLFSALISLVKPLLQNLTFSDTLLSTLEITNGVVLAQNNIYLTAFLMGFGGLSVHFQILSICENVRPNYLRFLLFRIIQGVLCSVIASFLLKIFKISTQVLNSHREFCFELSKYSIVFSVMLMICCLLFMLSVRKPDNLL